MNPVITVLVPIYNEAQNLPHLYRRLTQVLQHIGQPYELLLINDASKDESYQLIRQLAQADSRVKYINLSRNFGQQIALCAGIDACRGKYVVIIDADLQDPPELLPEMYHKLLSGYEVVFARRRKRKGERFFKTLTARLFYRFFRWVSPIDIPLDTGDFRIIDRKVVHALRRMPEQHKFLRGQVAWMGFRQTFIEYDRDPRFAGKTGYTLNKMFRLAMDAITSFSNAPLRLATWMGIVVSAIAFLLILYVLYSRFVLKDYVQGWTSIMISVLFLGGIQLICLGILGEYISRMNQNLRNRPLYLVQESNCEAFAHAHDTDVI
jgi:dolichol-phosphate mannosyltransferase